MLIVIFPWITQCHFLLAFCHCATVALIVCLEICETLAATLSLACIYIYINVPVLFSSYLWISWRHCLACLLSLSNFFLDIYLWICGTLAADLFLTPCLWIDQYCWSFAHCLLITIRHCVNHSLSWYQYRACCHGVSCFLSPCNYFYLSLYWDKLNYFWHLLSLNSLMSLIAFLLYCNFSMSLCCLLAIL